MQLACAHLQTSPDRILHTSSKFGIKSFLSWMFSLVTTVLSDFALLHLGYSAPKSWEILLKCAHLCGASLILQILWALSVSCKNVSSSKNAFSVFSLMIIYLGGYHPHKKKVWVLQIKEFWEAVQWFNPLVQKLNYFGSNLIPTTVPSSYVVLGKLFNLSKSPFIHWKKWE